MKSFYYVFLIAAISLAGCISSKKYSSVVNEKLQGSTDAKSTATYNDWLVIETNDIVQKESSFKQLERSFIPAIVYWGWNSTIETEIDPTVTVEYLENSIYKAADSLNLSDKVQGNKLVITLREVPGRFVYQNKGNVLFLFIAYTVSGVEAISPAQKALVASYEVQNGDKVTLSGDVLVRNSDEPVKNIWKTTKKFTWSYLDLYRGDTERMGTELVHKIMQKLEDSASANNY